MVCFCFVFFYILSVKLFCLPRKYFYSLAPIFVVSTKCIDPWVLEFVVSNITGDHQMGKLYFVGFFFSWFKWTTTSAKISSPRLIINSQYISLLCAFGIVCFYFIRSKYYYMLSVFCFLFLFYSFNVLYCAVGVNSYFTTSISVCLICSSIHKQFILITSAINVITVSMPVTLG